ncbi:MAG TPA: sugar phosphate nucleotidyltransferase [Cyclobacteriaceae bacterium]|nr:sugar phosphate nucleotidyltransferase [Cyclobacteriaceae bacterium]
MDLTLVIMAAGIGSRYGGVKQLEGIGPSGETLMDYSIHDAIEAGFRKVVFIIRRDLEEAFTYHYRNRFREMTDISFAFQDEFKKYEEGFEIIRSKPWGTGHAMLSTGELIKTPFAILNADDFYGAPAFHALAGALRENKKENRYFLVAYRLINTLSEFGTVSRGLCRLDDHHDLVSVKELTRIGRKGDEVVYEENGEFYPLNPDDLVSMNFWGFSPFVFTELNSRFKEFIKRNHSNPKAEFYIPTFVDGLIHDRLAKVHVLATEETWIGVTYKEDKPVVTAKIKEMVGQGLYPPKLGLTSAS